MANPFFLSQRWHMNRIVKIVIYLLGGGLIACSESIQPEEPSYSNEPRIEFIDVSYYNADNFLADSIVLTFSFTDGDDNLGHSQYNLDSPYHRLIFFSKALMEH